MKNIFHQIFMNISYLRYKSK